MSTGSTQRRNDEQISLLSADLTTRDEYAKDPARLLAARTMHRAFDQTQGAGGALLYDWLADQNAIDTFVGSQQLTTGNMGHGDYAATIHGGPYGDFNGTNEALWVTDASWQEVQTNTLAVWHWVNPASVAVVMTFASKLDVNANNRSWKLYLNNVGPAFEFLCNATGAAVNDVVVTSTVTPVVDTWYFIAGFFLASALMRIYVALASDTALTVTSLAAGIPASLFNGTAPLGIGARFNNAPTLAEPWSGLIGRGQAWVNKPAGTAASYPEIDAWFARQFQATRWFYNV